MWQILVVLLAVALVAVLVRYHLLKNSIGKMASAMKDIRNTTTNRQITVGMQQPQLTALAAAINILYEDLNVENTIHRNAMTKMRQSMANISHDLRTPLTSILGYLKLLRNGNNSQEQQHHYLEVAYKKAASLNQLVSGLFELARLESNGYTFNHERLDATLLLQEELADTYPLFEKKELIPVVELSEEPLWMIGDRQALSRIFGNLIQNMVKHGQSPIKISGKVQGKQVVFCFSNGAPTLNPADASKLFHRFYTADRMRTGKDTGLGLAIVKEFTEQMGGSVVATVQDNVFTVTVSWPLAVRAEKIKNLYSIKREC